MKTILALSIVVILSGCATTRQVNVTQSDQWMSDARHDLLNKNVRLTMVDGSTAEGKLVRLNGDSLSLQGKDQPVPRTELLSRVQSIQPSRKVLPVIGGVLGGALLGGIIGSQIGVSSEDSPHGILDVRSTAAFAGGMIVGWGLGAAAGGVGVGLLTSVTDYEIVRTEPGKPLADPGAGLPDTVKTAQ